MIKKIFLLLFQVNDTNKSLFWQIYFNSYLNKMEAYNTAIIRSNFCYCQRKKNCEDLASSSNRVFW